MKNRKTLILGVFLGVIMVSGAMVTSEASAASSWKNYFSQEEATSMKKMVSKYVRQQIEDNKDSWKGIISGKSIKKNSITANKIENGSISSDEVDDSIAKKSVYTGTIDPCDETSADATVSSGSDDYYLIIDAPEVEMSQNPIVNLYTRVVDGTSAYEASSDLWKLETSKVFFKEGEIYLYYGSSEDDGTCYFDEYKVSVSY